MTDALPQTSLETINIVTLNTKTPWKTVKEEERPCPEEAWGPHLEPGPDGGLIGEFTPVDERVVSLRLRVVGPNKQIKNSVAYSLQILYFLFKTWELIRHGTEQLKTMLGTPVAALPTCVILLNITLEVMF